MPDKVSTKLNKLSYKKLKNETSKYRDRFRAIRAFESGETIAKISRDLKKSRLTIYRWLHSASDSLASRKTTKRETIDEQSGNRIIELYILYKKPSMKKLSQSLRESFGMKIHPAKLRRFLMKKNLWLWTPSLFFDSALRSQVADLSPKSELHAVDVGGSDPR